MATTDKISYGSSTAITCTVASLASSATAGRQSAVVDNSSNLFDDVLVFLALKTSSSALANDKAIYVYLWGSEDGSTYSGSSAEGQGAGDSAMTMDDPTNMILARVIPCPAVSTTYKALFSVAQFFGGVMPKKWGLFVRNYTGQNLDSTGGNHLVQYTGIYYTNS